MCNNKDISCFGQTKIIIADDNPIIKNVLRSILTTREDFNVHSQEKDGASVLESIKENKTAIVTLYIEMPDLNGVEVLKQLKYKSS